MRLLATLLPVALLVQTFSSHFAEHMPVAVISCTCSVLTASRGGTFERLPPSFARVPQTRAWAFFTGGDPPLASVKGGSPWFSTAVLFSAMGMDIARLPGCRCFFTFGATLLCLLP